MGHTLADPDLVYQRLQQRLDRMPTGAPDSPAFQQILRLLFSPSEAELAARMPTICPVDVLADRSGIPADELDPMVTEMARKGLVVDLEQGGRRYVALAPVVIGFFEFTFMRVRDDAPIEELSALFEEYLFDGTGEFAHAVFAGSTQIGRSLVREEALPDDPQVEVLDWELATHIVGEAPSVAVSECPCRTHAALQGRACGAPTRTCLTLGASADALVRSGLAEPISNAEGLEILAQAKAAGLAQTADNVKHGVGYICNCCGCCCGMMQSIRRHGITGAVVSSNWVAHVDLDKCRGCKKCYRACPADAITIVDNEGQGLRKYWAIVDPEKCLGCGVCDERCRWGAHSMVPREARVFTPENTFDRMVTMAIERGKLGELLVDTLDGAGPHALSRALAILVEHQPAAAARAVEPLHSVFLRGMLAATHALARSGAASTPV
ncbi:MAG: 4Fe-4S dicluster domain-containing protein [Candidatus Nanopelagicales bacterium]|jgi:ferredoxin|nr:4Fe-4S dicluster domain-containing protein [Candidatus Nanopelagicales bacterium]